MDFPTVKLCDCVEKHFAKIITCFQRNDFPPEIQKSNYSNGTVRMVVLFTLNEFEPGRVHQSHFQFHLTLIFHLGRSTPMFCSTSPEVPRARRACVFIV
jgi:hypothetical protein